MNTFFLKYCFVLVLLGSCIPLKIYHKGEVKNEIRCKDSQMESWYNDCVDATYLKDNSSSEVSFWRKECSKKAKEIFCHEVKVVVYENHKIECETAPEYIKNKFCQ